MSLFKVGDRVKWKEGALRVRWGKVIEVVPPLQALSVAWMVARSFYQRFRKLPSGNPRPHESYLIEVTGKPPRLTPRLFWPQVRVLERMEEPSGPSLLPLVIASSHRQHSFYRNVQTEPLGDIHRFYCHQVPLDDVRAHLVHTPHAQVIVLTNSLSLDYLIALLLVLSPWPRPAQAIRLGMRNTRQPMKTVWRKD